MSAISAVGNLLRVASAGTVTTPRRWKLEIRPGSRQQPAGGGRRQRERHYDTGSANAQLNVNRGTLEFDGGVITANNLLVTNTAGKIVFNDGKLITRTATISNKQGFRGRR